MSSYNENWIGDRTFGFDRDCESVSMKPVMMDLLREAFAIAVVDSIDPDLITDARRIEIFRNPQCVTEEEWWGISPRVLASNIGIRLWGSGSHTVRGVYTGNATVKETYNACVSNTEGGGVDSFVADMRGADMDARPLDSPHDLIDGEAHNE